MFKTISRAMFIKGFTSISREKALGISIIVTLLVMALEIVYSFISNSLMLFSDGIHMLTHALSLVITLLSIIIARRTKNKFVELIAVAINSMTLFYFGIYIFFEAIDRFLDPRAIQLGYTLSVAIIGLIVNIFTAILLNQAGIEDLNTKSAFAHMISDTILSIAIVLGAVCIYYTGYNIIDAILSFVVAIMVIKWACDLLRSTAIALKFVGGTRMIYDNREKK